MQQVEQFRLHHFSPEMLVYNRQMVQPAIENFEYIVEPDLQMVLAQISYVSSGSVIGGIVIEDVDIQLPILAGSTHYNLLVGATTIGHNLTMGEGNFVLAGHNMSQGGVLFSRLVDVVEGALIHVTDGIYVYTYQVIERAIIHQNEVSVLEPTETAMITLITCDQPTVWTPNRLMVRGKLIAKEKIQANLDSHLDFESSSVTLIQEMMSRSQVPILERNAFTTSLIGVGVCSSLIILVLASISSKNWKKIEKAHNEKI